MSLHEFVAWFRHHLVYQPPDAWAGQIEWFFEQLRVRYDDAPDLRPPLFPAANTIAPGRPDSDVRSES